MTAATTILLLHTSTTLHFSLLFLLFQHQGCVQLCHGQSTRSFLVLGDWGGLPISPYRSPIEKQVAAAMNTIAGECNTSFQVALGDNFYFDGVKDVNDKRFLESFETVFIGKNLQTPWYFVAGNHDWNGNVTAQVDYSNRSKRWNFPSLYYTKTVISPDGAVLQLVLIDTIVLCGHLWSDFYYYDDGLKLLDKKASDDQWAWIEQQLAGSKADYLLVGGHYPVYSIAEHGPTDCLVQRLRPLLFKYSVTAYLSGHDHNSQHLHEEDAVTGQPMDYFVTGSANFAENSTRHIGDVPANSSMFFNADKVGGFGLVSFNKTQLSMTIISGDNKELYQKSLKPRSTY